MKRHGHVSVVERVADHKVHTATEGHGHATWRVKKLKQGLRRVSREAMVAEKAMEIQRVSQAKDFVVLKLSMRTAIR